MPISHSVSEGIAEVVMNNPPVNALTVAGCFDLADVVRRLGADPDVRVLILAAEGRPTHGPLFPTVIWNMRERSSTSGRCGRDDERCDARRGVRHRVRGGVAG